MQMFVSKRRYNDLVIKNTINADRGDRYYAKWLNEIDMYKSAKREAGAAEKMLAHTEQHLRSAENALHEKDEKIQRQARELQAKDQKIVEQHKQIRGLKVQVCNLERRAARAGMAAAEKKALSIKWLAEMTGVEDKDDGYWLSCLCPNCAGRRSYHQQRG